MPNAPWPSKKVSSVCVRIAGTGVTGMQSSYSHLSGVNLEVLVEVVSEVKKVRDNGKHCPQLELPCLWGLGRHVQIRRYYAF